MGYQAEGRVRADGYLKPSLQLYHYTDLAAMEESGVKLVRMDCLKGNADPVLHGLCSKGLYRYVFHTSGRRSDRRANQH